MKNKRKARGRGNGGPECALETYLVHGRRHTQRWDYQHHLVPPISSSAAYRLVSAERGAEGFEQFADPSRDPATSHPVYVYDRLDEPTRGMLEDALARAEGGEIAVTFASGMAAISAAIGVSVQTGDEVLCHRTLYGCTASLFGNWLPRFGVKVRAIDLRDTLTLKAALTPRTRVVYLETPANPTLEVIDIRATRRALPAKDRPRIVVDNTFATPYCQRPLEHGADLVVQSLTKGINGFGTDLGGAVIGPRRLWHDLLLFRKDFGGVLSPKSAWPVLVYGLPTLSVRMRRQQETAHAIAEFLSRHPAVERVTYPGLVGFPNRDTALRQMRARDGGFAPGSLVYFIVRGGAKAARTVLDRIASHAYAITLAVSLGQVRTLVESPTLMTHHVVPPEERARMDIEEGGIRLSAGLEDPEDLIRDLEDALGWLGKKGTRRRVPRHVGR